jgi:predicted enzyme related to lactoylglutathione lyase
MRLLAEAAPVSFILTADRARAKPFYAGALGLSILSEDEFSVIFALEGGACVRLTDLPGHEAGEQTVLGWNVPDIGAAVAELKLRGITFRNYQGFGQDDEGIWATPDGSAKVAWFTDPDENVLSLTQFG